MFIKFLNLALLITLLGNTNQIEFQATYNNFGLDSRLRTYISILSPIGYTSREFKLSLNKKFELPEDLINKLNINQYSSSEEKFYQFLIQYYPLLSNDILQKNTYEIPLGYSKLINSTFTYQLKKLGVIRENQFGLRLMEPRANIVNDKVTTEYFSYFDLGDNSKIKLKFYSRNTRNLKCYIEKSEEPKWSCKLSSLIFNTKNYTNLDITAIFDTEENFIIIPEELLFDIYKNNFAKNKSCKYEKMGDHTKIICEGEKPPSTSMGFVIGEKMLWLKSDFLFVLNQFMKNYEFLLIGQSVNYIAFGVHFLKCFYELFDLDEGSVTFYHIFDDFTAIEDI